MREELRLLGVGLALAAVLTSGCAADNDGERAEAAGAAEDRRSVPLYPERTADPVVLTGGGEGSAEWELVLQDSAEGFCLGLRVDGKDGTEGCGFEVPLRHDVAFFVADEPDGATFVAGAVVTDAVGVRLEVVGEPPVEAEIVGQDAGSASNFFVSPLPDGSALQAVVAVDGNGGVLERRSATTVEEGPDGADGSGEGAAPGH